MRVRTDKVIQCLKGNRLDVCVSGKLDSWNDLVIEV